MKGIVLWLQNAAYSTIFTGLFGGSLCVYAMDGLEYSQPQQIGFHREKIDALLGEAKESVGSVTFTLGLKGDPELSRCKICTLFVHGLFRNKGIGTGLLNRVVDRVASLGYEEIEWKATPYGDKPLDQGELNAFYRKRFEGASCEGNDFQYVLPEKVVVKS